MFPYNGPKLSHKEQMDRDEALYQEAQSRMRLSMLCRSTVHELRFPLYLRIVELARVQRLEK